MQKQFIVFAIVILIGCAFQNKDENQQKGIPDLTSEEEMEVIDSEIEEAKAFLNSIYTLMPLEFQSAMKQRVKIGDKIRDHRAILSLAGEIQYHPYTGSFVFSYFEGGRTYSKDADSFWRYDIITNSTLIISKHKLNSIES